MSTENQKLQLLQDIVDVQADDPIWLYIIISQGFIRNDKISSDDGKYMFEIINKLVSHLRFLHQAIECESEIEMREILVKTKKAADTKIFNDL